MTDKQKKVTKKPVLPRISEKQRTVILFILLAIAISTLYYIQNNVDSNFVETL